MKNSALLLAVSLALCACGADVVLPPAQPLSARPEQLAAIPNLAAGSLAVKKSAPLQWQGLRLRVLQPETPGRYPLIVFSHGNWSDIDKYDALLEHWVSHGYVVLAPYHQDGGGMARGIFNALRHGNEGLIASRVADVKNILDHLNDLDALQPHLASQVDTDRIAVTGHSFGAFTAQMMGGAAAVNLENGERVEGQDKRVRAVLAISPPGPMFDIINDQSWKNMDAPMLVTTGTWDVNAKFWPEWQAHRLSYDTAAPGRNWLLVVEGADHYLGNLICRPERKEPPQRDALLMVNALSVTFLNAELKHDALARDFLEHNTLQNLTGGFARLEHR